MSSKLNRDVLYSIFEESQDDKAILYSCLLVNKAWCEMIIPILWKDPWKSLNGTRKSKLFLTVIISLLPDKSRNNLIQHVDFLLNTFQRPFIDYISFCKHLNFNELERIFEEFEISIDIKNEIFELFINGNSKFTHLYIPYQFDSLIPGVKRCFSEIEFLSCNACINNEVLSGLVEICKSIKELELFFEEYNNNHGIIRLIQTPRKLYKVRFQTDREYRDESLNKILENSLIKHANTIQYFRMSKEPSTEFISSFRNLRILEIYGLISAKWHRLRNVSMPFLRILNVQGAPVTNLIDIIENTNGLLTVINMDIRIHNEFDNKRIIRSIYQNAPNLQYLRLLIRNSDSLEIKNLLTNCQCLIGLYFLNYDLGSVFDWDNLFNLLTESSPETLCKFKFCYHSPPVLKSLKLFFDNWKGRRRMLLQTIQMLKNSNMEHFDKDFIEKYKEMGVLKSYANGEDFEDFEWTKSFKKNY
jgi:hypothetical protein